MEIMPYAVPTLIKQLRGTDQPCRITPNEPEPPLELPLEAPAGLTSSQAELWAELVRTAAPRLLRSVDSGVLLQYVVARDLFARAAAEINRDGYILTHRGKRGVHPAVYVLNSQAVTMRQCEQELGFTPASRSRINTAAGADGENGTAAEGHWKQLAMGYP